MSFVSCLFGAVLATCLSFGAAAHHPQGAQQPPWQAPSSWPDRIITTIAGDPATSFSVTWRTDHSVGAAIAQITPARNDSRFDLDAETFTADTAQQQLDVVAGPHGEEKILTNQGLPPVHYHSITFKGLDPDTLYAYRVRGEKGRWSAWRQIRTAPKDGPVRFIFFGDAQTGIRSHITRSFDTAARIAPDARFAIHGGDIVNTAMYDKEWAEWFEALGRTHKVMPAIPAAGNHDYINFDKGRYGGDRVKEKNFVAERAVDPLWTSQFTLPEVPELPEGLRETVYDVRYTKDLHIFVLDSTGIAWDAQLGWLEGELAKSDARWKVVTMHHPIYSHVGGREHPAHKERRLAFLKVMERNDIDVIITGHRHSYQRGDYGDGVARFDIGDDHKVDSVFIITAASTKRGESKVQGWQEFSDAQGGDFKLERHADNVPLFAVFDLDGDTLSYRAVDALGDIYDAFMLTKDADGQKTIKNGEEALGPILDRSNTGRYRKWDDLR